MKLNLKSLIAKAGGTSKVAQVCGVTPGAVSQWLSEGRLPLTEVQGKTDYSKRILELVDGFEVDEWDVRLIGRR